MRKLIKQRTNPPPTEQKGEAGLSTAKLQEIKEEDHGTIQHKGFQDRHILHQLAGPGHHPHPLPGTTKVLHPPQPGLSVEKHLLLF